MNQKKTDTKNKQAMAAVEFALMLPVFFMLLFGVIDAARLLWTQSVVRDAAFEGARLAILNEPTNTQVEETVQEELAAGGVNEPAGVTIGLREAEQPVDVTVSVPFEFIILGNLIPSLSGETPIAATAVMRHER